jgi:flagellar motility protein MotE (MotC chaperone)
MIRPVPRMVWEGLAVFLLALALRAVHLHDISPIPSFLHPQEDALSYSSWAHRLASGDWLDRTRGVFQQSPLYPYVLALDRRLGKTLAAQSRVLMGLSESQERWNQRVEEMEKRRTDSEAEDLRLKAEIQSLSEKVRTVEAALRARQEAEKLAAKKMGKMVANMPPGKAADLLQELDDISAVGLLTQMKEPDVARVLALLPPKRAAGLTERMAEFRVKTP